MPESSIAKYLADIPFRSDLTYSEILVFALKTEENAYQLYKAAAGMTDDPRLQKVLMNFADVELGHRRKIEAIYEERVLTEGWKAGNTVGYIQKANHSLYGVGLRNYYQ